jgi:hypothetical protein
MFTQNEMDKAEYLAFQERLASHTIGILTDGGRGVGTGTLASFNGHRVILTAHHVIKDNPISKLRFSFRPEGNLEEVPMQHVPLPGRQIPLLSGALIESTSVVTDEANDVTALVLHEEYQIGGAAAVYGPLQQPMGNIPDGTSVLLLGFPVGNSINVAPNIKAVGAVSDHMRYDSKLNEKKYLPSSFDPESQFLLEYEWAKDGLLPHGFSGAGLWCSRNSNTPVWTPNPFLIGVVTSYLKRSNLLVAANRKSILALLAQIRA